ncbi:AAA family ATPase [Massilia sp. MS-15]|uniref:AAA family ATPase n=1 Tax=Massilia sp. MS-15 TaxID=2878200 RepID=UPI001CD7644D|nr:AAA family ATPase [Massilia sp. MS-15]MCA1245524.1 AAA family ATPase [Massilia sp. MS-15]
MKALLISRASQLHAEIASLGAARAPLLEVCAVRASLREALDRPESASLQLLIVDASEIEPSEAALLERLGRQYPGTQLMLLADQHHPELLIRAMRAGVRDVLQLPLVQRAFHEALDRAAAAAGISTLREGKVLAFIACKGGSGATFISTNFGYALATLSAKRVLLIDLNRQFGDAALYVSDQKPAMTLSDVCAQIARVDGPFLESCVVHVTPGFGVLAAADDAAHAKEARPEHIDSILRVARQHYDYVLLDIGRQIDAVSLRALDVTDTIYPVLQLALPDIRDARRLLDIFRSLGYALDDIRLIVNRYEKGGKLRLQDLHTALGCEVVHTFPNDYVAVTDSVNQGVPVLQLSRASAAARSLVELVELVTGSRVQESRGLLERLFGRGEPND